MTQSDRSLVFKQMLGMLDRLSLEIRTECDQWVQKIKETEIFVNRDDWSSIYLLFSQTLSYGFPEEDPLIEVMNIILSEGFQVHNGMGSLHSTFDKIILTLSPKDKPGYIFDYTLDNSWSLFWDLVNFSFTFYQYFLDYDHNIIESHSSEDNRTPKDYLFHNFPLFVQPNKLFLAFNFCIQKVLNNENINLLGLEGSFEMGFFLYLWVYASKHNVGDFGSFRFFSCIWNDFIIRFAGAVEKGRKDGLTFPCKLFSFLFISSLSLASLNIEEVHTGQRILRYALQVVYRSAPNSLKGIFDSMSPEFFKYFVSLFGMPCDKEENIMTMNLHSTTPFFRFKKGDQRVKLFHYYVTKKLLLYDPGELINDFRRGGSLSPYFLIDNKFFILCTFYNGIIVILSQAPYDDIPLPHPINFSINEIVPKKSFQYLGKEPFITLIVENYSEETIDQYFGALVNVCFSQFNPLDDLSTKYLTEGGYLFWRSSLSDRTVRTQSFIWQSVQKALVTKLSEITGHHIVYKEGHEPELEEGKIKDYNDTSPLAGLDFLLAEREGVNVSDILNDVFLSPFQNLGPEDLHKAFLEKDLGWIVDDLELVAICSFITCVVLGGQTREGFMEEIRACFKMLPPYGKNPEIPLNPETEDLINKMNLKKLKEDLDLKVSPFIAHLLFRGDEFDCTESPWLELNKFLACFCTVFLTQLGLPVDTSQFMKGPDARVDEYFSSFDWGIIFDMRWDFFFACFAAELSEESFPEGDFLTTLHPLNQHFSSDVSFGEILFKGRHFNKKTLYGLHDFVGNIEYKGIFSMLINQEEYDLIKNNFEQVPSQVIKSFSPVIFQLVEDDLLLAAYTRSRMELRQSWWSLVGTFLLGKMSDFFDEAIEGFHLLGPEQSTEDQDHLKRLIEEVLSLLGGALLNICGQSLLTEGFKNFYNYLRGAYERIIGNELVNPSLKIFYLVSIYFQVSLAYNYWMILVGPRHIFERLGRKDMISSCVQSACCSISFFPSFTSLETHYSNICSIFDVLLFSLQLQYETGDTKKQIFRSQVLLAYLMFCAFEEEPSPHYRALTVAQQVLFDPGEFITDMAKDLDAEETFTSSESTEVDCYLPFIGFSTKINPFGESIIPPGPSLIYLQVISDFKISDCLKALLIPYTILEQVGQDPSSFRELFKEWIANMMMKNYNPPAVSKPPTPWEFFKNIYSTREPIELKQN